MIASSDFLGKSMYYTACSPHQAMAKLGAVELPMLVHYALSFGAKRLAFSKACEAACATQQCGHSSSTRPLCWRWTDMLPFRLATNHGSPPLPSAHQSRLLEAALAILCRRPSRSMRRRPGSIKVRPWWPSGMLKKRGCGHRGQEHSTACSGRGTAKPGPPA